MERLSQNRVLHMRYNAEFVNSVKALWNEKKGAFSGLPGYIEEMADRISLSQAFDEELWPYKNEANRNDNHDYYEGWWPRGTVVPFTTAVGRMIENFNARLQWMDAQINALGTTNPDFLFENPGEW